MSVSWQVLDALQYLHHRGIVHLNVQPDNVVMVSRRRLDVKLIDFGRARRVTSAEGVGVAAEGTAEFMCEYDLHPSVLLFCCVAICQLEARFGL